jgi:hypothetical protein
VKIKKPHHGITILVAVNHQLSAFRHKEGTWLWAAEKAPDGEETVRG